MMDLLFMDFETQGADIKTTEITEVGASFRRMSDDGLSNVEVVGLGLSKFLYSAHYAPQTEFIKDLTGITDEMLKAEGRPPGQVLEYLSNRIQLADYVFAHKVAFDRGVYEASCTRYGVEVRQPKRAWICTLTEVPWPKKYVCRKLAHLAYDHGILVHPDTLHRAKADVDLLAELILTKYKLSDILEYASSPWVYLQIDVPKPWDDGGQGVAFAKNLGYFWQTPKGLDGVFFEKKWVKRLKEHELEPEKTAAIPYTLYRLSLPEKGQNV